MSDNPITTTSIEQDTLESEDILNLTEFLLPQGLENYDQFGLHFNKKVFNGWVKQPSPCCGAASVAGAWNSLCNVHRLNAKAITHADILRVYGDLFTEMIAKKKESFERRLGSRDTLNVLLNDLLDEIVLLGNLKANDKSNDASSEGNLRLPKLKKKAGITKSVMISVLKGLLTRRRQGVSSNHSNSEADSANDTAAFSHVSGPGSEEPPSNLPSALDLLAEMMVADGLLSSIESVNNVQEDNGNIINNNESDSDDVCDDSGDEIEAPPRKSSNAKIRNPSIWNWQKDLLILLKNISGLEKLRSTTRPSTAPVGNAVLLECIIRVTEYSGLGSSAIEGRLFMGKKLSPKTKVDFPLSRKDSVDLIQAQWDGLRAAFSRPDTVLLFHLTNHYALVFALREWVETDTSSTSNNSTEVKDDPTNKSDSLLGKVKVVRQILSARRGQRPSAWIDFLDAREIMLSWEGYKVMAIKRCVAEEDLRENLAVLAPICKLEK